MHAYAIETRSRSTGRGRPEFRDAYYDPFRGICDRAHILGTIPDGSLPMPAPDALRATTTPYQLWADFADTVDRVWQTTQVFAADGPYSESFWLRIDPAPGSEYDARLDELRVAAFEDGFAVHEESVKDFRTFLAVAPPGMTRPDLSLVDEGDVRAFWRDGNTQVGVQFMGGGKVEYVLLDDNPRVRRGSLADFWSDDPVLAGLLTS